MTLVKPAHEHLASYLDAFERGYGGGNVGSADEVLAKIEQSPEAFFEQFDDPEALAGPVRLPDGSLVPRIPGLGRWMWDGEFCGSIGLRWQPGTTALPPTCLGHIGYDVVPWKRRRGYATAALAQMLPAARANGLPFVELVTDIDNAASQRVIRANGGVLVERFEKRPANGGGQAFRFRIDL